MGRLFCTEMITGSPWICPRCTYVCYVTALGLREIGNSIRQLCIPPPLFFKCKLAVECVQLKLQPYVRFPAGCVHWQMDGECGTMFESPQQSAGVVGSVPVFHTRGWESQILWEIYTLSGEYVAMRATEQQHFLIEVLAVEAIVNSSGSRG